MGFLERVSLIPLWRKTFFKVAKLACHKQTPYESWMSGILLPLGPAGDPQAKISRVPRHGYQISAPFPRQYVELQIEIILNNEAN